jgi:ubiquitin-conjugating enzyme E2 Q
VETLKIPDMELKPEYAHSQDPARTPQGLSGTSIIIPAAAIKSGKAVRTAEVKENQLNHQRPLKKLKLLGGQSNPVVLDDDEDGASVATDLEDLDILFDEQMESAPITPDPIQNVPTDLRKKAEPNTDFVPGSLDFSKLPVMPVPTYAQSGTTKRLMKELIDLHKVQSSTPIAELGWYIDTEKIENAYQWIVELHSFHTFEDKGKKLPLSEDMKKQKITSIVLEVNFNKDFPFTPPYVRVIRPRFLSLMQGGGGHIVMGGAMCMELLTNTGWSGVSSMESVLMQVRLALASEPYARLEASGKGGDYGTMEAATGYLRACETHGWEVPPGFRQMAMGNGS